jgi:hypothetical protein
VRLALAVAGMVVLACTSCTGAKDSRQDRVTARTQAYADCSVPRRTWSRMRFSPRFFPRAAEGLWAPTERPQCLFVVPSSSNDVRLLWHAGSRSRIRSVMWSPDGKTVLLTIIRRAGPSQAVVVDRDGRTLSTLRADSASFLRDGRLVAATRSGIFLVSAGARKLLAPRTALSKAAGFSSNRRLFVGEDPAGYARGYGRTAVALSWTQARPQVRNTVLVVSAAGAVRRATPVFTGVSLVGGRAWSNDGRTLFLMDVAPTPPGFQYDHDHCLDSWTARAGYQRLWCVTQLPKAYRFHFDKLVWSRHDALLNNGTIINEAGHVVGRLRLKGSSAAFGLHWPYRNR